MTVDSPKSHLHRYLRDARGSLLWKIDGLSEYDARRPLTPHGTNVLGLIKHLSGCEIGYFGEVFGRPFPDPPLWLIADGEDDRDMWATADESRGDIVDLYRRASEHSDATIESLELDHPGDVPAWGEHHRAVTLHQIMVHMLAETARHVGHADIVRELIDGSAGLWQDRPGVTDSDDPHYWPRLHDRIENAARRHTN